MKIRCTMDVNIDRSGATDYKEFLMSYYLQLIYLKMIQNGLFTNPES